MSLEGQIESKILKSIKLGGTPKDATASGATGGADILLVDGSGDTLLVTGTAVPSDATSGYAKGCLYIDTNVATGTTGLNCNKGTNTSCVFTAVTQA